ncbi:MFS transporter [Streptomyces albus]|uniref:MFS transporter n=1 Tax=Streptomyces albus TaxID=1888 RepID=A0A8H1L8J4_9ACTN|nr:MFS transporter [Streptomyces albus]
MRAAGPGEPGRRRTIWLAVALIVVALNLRPAIVAMSPLLDEVRSATGLTSTAAGLLTTLPVLCFGLFAPVAPRLARKAGMEASPLVVLVVLLAGVGLRLAGSVTALFAGTFLVGVAIAMGNVLLPGIIKRDFPHKAGLMTGLYSMALFGGAALAAGLTVPVQHAASLGWRPALALWGVLAVIAVLCWAPQLSTEHRDMAPSHPVRAVRGLWREPLAWYVALFMGFQSLNYYTATAWLPAIFTAHGMSAGQAGWMLSLSSILGIVSSLAGPVLAGRTRSQGWLAVVAAVLCCAGLAGMMAAPVTGAWVWMVLLGLGQGVAISVSLALIVLRAPDARHAAQLSSMAQCVGYLLAALGPLVLGAVHDATHDWTTALTVLAALLVPQTLFGVLAGRDRYVGRHERQAAAQGPVRHTDAEVEWASIGADADGTR